MSAPPDDSYLFFAPVPLARVRASGWTSEKQRAFVMALAELGNVSMAARSVGMSPRGAYALRARPGAESFADAWDRALLIGLDRARDMAIERVVRGIEVPVVRGGRVVGTQRRFEHRLMGPVMRALRGAAHGMPNEIEERLAYRARVREADERLGGPLDWDALPHVVAEREAEARRREYESLLADPDYRADIERRARENRRRHHAESARVRRL